MFYLKKSFLTGHLRAAASDNLKLNIQTFNSKYLNSNSNSNNSILINIVGTLYLMSRFCFYYHAFRTSILQSSYYKNNF